MSLAIWYKTLVEDLFGNRGVFETTRDVVTSFLKTHKRLLTAVCLIGFVRHVQKTISLKKSKQWDKEGKDVVVLHALARGNSCPHLSPFVLKVETYLRMAGIKYVFDEEYPWGPKGKMPWISFNGKAIPDSEFIIEHLGSYFENDFSSYLSEKERAIARAFVIMNDEYLFWGLIYWRFVKSMKTIGKFMPLQWHYHISLPYIYGLYLFCQGFGRHSEEEKLSLVKKGLKSISVYLGDKDFLMGAEPCEVDCAIFSVVVQYLRFLPEIDIGSFIKKDCGNLESYCDKMQMKFFPDWEAPSKKWGF